MAPRIAHVVTPVTVPPHSELAIAQPIVFESMRRAKKENVELLAVPFADENIIPSGFTKAGELTRSAKDLSGYNITRKLPILSDILHAAAQSSGAEYLIYINADIILAPNFYHEVTKLIEQGHDAFVINRRTVSDHWKSVDDLPKIINEEGRRHPGYDCFIFPRSQLH